VWSEPLPTARTGGDAGEGRGETERGGYERDRPRDRDRERDRDRPRSFGRNRDRDRGDRPARREDRPNRPERADRPARPDRPERRGPPPLRNDPPPAEREFWEVWSEEKAQKAAGDAPAPAGDVPTSPVAPVSPFPSSGGDAPSGDAPSGDAPGGDAPSGDVARLYLNLGRKDGASERDVRGLISTHVPDASVSDVDVMNTHTYLNVAPGDADRIVRALTGQELSGRQLVCEPAKPRRR
jgi:hypothetical protein